MKVKIQGVVYPSVKVAASALGVSVGAVYQALGRGTEDRIGLGRDAPRPGVVTNNRGVTIGGVTYASITEASEALGIKRNTLSKKLCRMNERDAQDIIRLAVRSTKRPKIPI